MEMFGKDEKPLKKFQKNIFFFKSLDSESPWMENIAKMEKMLAIGGILSRSLCQKVDRYDQFFVPMIVDVLQRSLSDGNNLS